MTLSHAALHSVIATTSMDACVMNSQRAANLINPDGVRLIPLMICTKNLKWLEAFGMNGCPHWSSCGIVPGVSAWSIKCSVIVVDVIVVAFSGFVVVVVCHVMYLLWLVS